MEQSLFERMGGTYHCEGDYLIPDLVVPKAPQIGVWGERRRQFLMKHRKPIYTGMLLSGKLNTHLEEIDGTATEMLFQLVNEMAKREGITEQLKANDQMAWVGAMNCIRAKAEEVVATELIYN